MSIQYEDYYRLIQASLRQINELGENSIQTCIAEIPDINGITLGKTNELLSNLAKQIWRVCKQDATVWITVNHQYFNNRLIPFPFEVCDIFQKTGFYVQNIITWINPKNVIKNKLFCNFNDHILFLTKSKTDYQFSKDPIREKHIWKDIEWGNRKFRYNPKGKDPGNVWIMMKDDGKGNIIEHVPLNYENKTERIILASTKNGDKILAISGDIHVLKKLADKYNLTITHLAKDIKNNIHEFNTATILSEKISSNEKFFYDVYFKSSEKMNEVGDDSVSLIVTSPPYWDLKNYGVFNQIGYGESYDKYHKRMNSVWSECFRTLKQSGTLWINVNSRTVNGKFVPLHYDIIKNVENIGFTLFDVLIWHKSSGIPVGENNFTDRFEFILGFAKSRKVFINNKENIMLDYKMREKVEHIPDVWNINRFTGSIGKKFEHPAMFPDELPRRLINIFTLPGNVVSDPFLGSGTTLLVAMKEKRSAIGYEINTNYQKLIEYRSKFFKPQLTRFIIPINYHTDKS